MRTTVEYDLLKKINHCPVQLYVQAKRNEMDQIIIIVIIKAVKQIVSMKKQYQYTVLTIGKQPTQHNYYSPNLN